MVQGKWLDEAFICGSYRHLTRDCTMHYISAKKIEAALLSAIQRVSWYVHSNEKEFAERVRQASEQRQTASAKEYRQNLERAKRRCGELDELIKKLYEGNATGKIPDRHFTRLLAEYDEEQTGLEASISEWKTALDNRNAERLKADNFIKLVNRYADFSELTTPMLNEFIEKIVVHEGAGRGKSRRQRLDIYLSFIGAFEVPAEIVTPMEQEEQHRKCEHDEALKERQKARREKRNEERRAFTARKKAGLLTLEEHAADEVRLARNRAWQKEQRDKRRAAQPPKPPKPRSIQTLLECDKTGLAMTEEERERLSEYRRKKNEQHREWRKRQKEKRPPKPRTLKELDAAQKDGETLTAEEEKRLHESRNRKKLQRQELIRQAETDPEAAAVLAKMRADQCAAVTKSRQKMCEEAANGNPEAILRYEKHLAMRRENYRNRKNNKEVPA